jgi:hypothetical protein
MYGMMCSLVVIVTATIATEEASEVMWDGIIRAGFIPPSLGGNAQGMSPKIFDAE